MTEKKINELAAYIGKNTKDADLILAGMTSKEKAFVILNGDGSRIANAMFSSIANAFSTKNQSDPANTLYSILKDTLLNLFKYDDSFREDFVKDMMMYCSTNNTAN